MLTLTRAAATTAGVYGFTCAQTWPQAAAATNWSFPALPQHATVGSTVTAVVSPVLSGAVVHTKRQMLSDESALRRNRRVQSAVVRMCRSPTYAAMDDVTQQNC